MGTKARLHGLDVLRAAAILMVLAAHYPKGDAQGLWVRALNFGWAGVDLFFVLSGYLICRQALEGVSERGDLSLRDFYLARLTRTLPCYYVVLAVYFALGSAPGGESPSPAWRFLSFTQNFGIPNAFEPSWSLCVEEHFYAIFPLVLLALIRFGRERALVGCCTVLLAAGLALRAGLWVALRPDLQDPSTALSTYMTHFYYPTYCRLDGIVLGVALAAVEQMYPAAWRRLMDRGNQLAAASGLCLALAMAALWVRYSLLCCTVGLFLLNVSFCLLAAAAVSEKSVFAGLTIPGAETIALLSYSLYLTHLFALEAADSVARSVGTSLQSLPGGLLAAALLISLSTLLYAGVERPVLNMRRRLLTATRSRRPLRELVSVPEA